MKSKWDMIRIKPLINVIAAMAILLCGSNAYAVTNYTHFGRYLTVTNAADGNDPYGINGIVQRQFPDNIQTIGGAVRYTLSGTGYHLLPRSYSTSVVNRLYGYPLPVYLRSIGPMSLKSALLKLSGDTYQLVVDPVHRLITYRLRNNYQGL